MSEADRPTAVVVDIDGVVADVRHRLHHVATKPKDWEAFFRDAALDPVLAEGARLVTEIARKHEIVWLSGRPEHCRVATTRWLAEQGLPQGRLLLRSRRDFRPGATIKLAAVRTLAAEYSVVLILDDDRSVCDTLRQAGFETRLATWMTDEETRPVLDDAQRLEGRT